MKTNQFRGLNVVPCFFPSGVSHGLGFSSDFFGGQGCMFIEIENEVLF